jgi:hypothetical protein
MAGYTLNTMSLLQCPHGGKVTIIPANGTVLAGGAPVALASDTFLVVGCPFTLPGTPPIPSPCVAVRWLVSDLRARANGIPTLSQSSVGLCLNAAQVPQGPVVVTATQTQVSTQ